MRGRRRARGELPYAPLLMMHPLDLPGAVVPGAAIVEEVATVVGTTLFSMHDQVLSWTHEPRSFAGSAEWWSTIERELLSLPETEFGQPAGVLAGYLCRPGEMDRKGVASACLAVSDWALGRGFRGTAAAFARVAALAWVRNPRFACVAGGILLACGEPGEAEWWYARAHRLAVWTRDRVATVRALIGAAAAVGQRAGSAEARPAYRRAVEAAAALGLGEVIDEALAELALSLKRLDPPRTEQERESS